MKKTFYILLGFGLLISCSKGNDPNNIIENGSCKVTSMSHLYDEEVSKIAYDEKGRIVKYYSEPYPIYTFTYSKTQIKVLKKYLSGAIDWETMEPNETPSETPYEYTLDDQNRIVKRTTIDFVNNLVYTYNYKYSADGFLIAITGNEGKILTQIDYNNGNMSVLNNVFFSAAYDVESDPSKPYMPLFNLLEGMFSDNADEQDYILYEQGFFGKLPKNRIVKLNGINGHNSVRTFIYKEDSNGNVTSIDRYHIYKNPNQPQQSTVKTGYFTYDCK